MAVYPYSLEVRFYKGMPVYILLTGDMAQHGKSLYGSCGSRNSRQITRRAAVFKADSDRQCWSQFTIEVCGSKTNFPLPFLKYWS